MTELSRFNLGLHETDSVVDCILHLIPDRRIVTFRGEVGAGKTTLIKALVKAMGSADAVSSPTFSLVNEYHAKNGLRIFHSDWYRITSPIELCDAGIEEYLYDNESVFLIEWPEVGATLLDGLPCIEVVIHHEETGRSYQVSAK